VGSSQARKHKKIQQSGWMVVERGTQDRVSAIDDWVELKAGIRQARVWGGAQMPCMHAPGAQMPCMHAPGSKRHTARYVRVYMKHLRMRYPRLPGSRGRLQVKLGKAKMTRAAASANTDRCRSNG
jgi:hypothetical protein